MSTWRTNRFLCCKAQEKDKGFDAEAFYIALAKVVQARNVRWRQVARETGVAPSTLTRMGQGRRPDAASLAVLSAWAGINPADFVEKPDNHAGRPRDSARPAADPMVAIAGLLRTDSNLQPGAAKALEDIIHIAYDKFKRSQAQEK
jgi:transcriptional regulator with XRE-family HTH domain